MKNAVPYALSLMLLWALTLIPLRDIEAQRKTASSSARAAKGAEEQKKPTTAQLLEEQQFVFSQRNRRDPFRPIGGGGGEEAASGEAKPLTDQDVEEARKTLIALTLACKDHKAAEFQPLYDQLMKRLAAQCETEDLQIHAIEIKRRARNLTLAMGYYERTILWERELQWAEEQLNDMEKDAASGNVESLKRRYNDVRERIGAKIKDVDDPRYQNRMRDVLRNSAKLLAKFQGGMVESTLDAAEKQIAKMRDLLKAQDYTAVGTEYTFLRANIEQTQIEDPALAKKRERILRTAEDIKRQAEIGTVKQMLAKAKADLAEMEKTFEAQEYSTIEDLNRKLQDYLERIPSLEPELDDERAIYKRKGIDLDRRAKICIEFRSAPPTISGIAWHPQRPAAIVNTKTVGLNDFVNANTRVKSIGQESVVFSYKGESIEIPLTAGQ